MENETQKGSRNSDLSERSQTENSSADQHDAATGSQGEKGEVENTNDSFRGIRQVLNRTRSNKSYVDPGPPPDGGLQAWTQLVLAHLTVFNTWGYINSFGVFQTYYVITLEEPPSAISWVGSVQIFLHWDIFWACHRLWSVQDDFHDRLYPPAPGRFYDFHIHQVLASFLSARYFNRLREWSGFLSYDIRGVHIFQQEEIVGSRPRSVWNCHGRTSISGNRSATSAKNRISLDRKNYWICHAGYHGSYLDVH